LVDTAIVLDGIATSGLIPVSRIEGRLGSLVSNDELEADFGGGIGILPTEKFIVRAQKNLHCTYRME
jgi:hypothetical protein